MKKSLKLLPLLALVLTILAFTVAPAAGFGGGCDVYVENPDGSECLLIGANPDGFGVYSCEHTNGDEYISVGACLMDVE